MLCSKCKKRVAMIYVSRIENGETINEGLCLRCAKEMGLAPVDDMMKKMGISDEDLDSISNEISELMEDEDFSPGRRAQPQSSEQPARAAARPGTRTPPNPRSRRPARVKRAARKRTGKSRSRASTSISTATASTSPSRRATASSTASSAGRRRSTAWCRFSTAAPRTTPA